MADVTVTNILTTEEGLRALDMDSDSADADKVDEYVAIASFFIYRRTNKNWGTTNKLAKQCCELVIAKNYYKDADHDFSKPIDMLLSDLNDIVEEESANETAA